MTCSKKFTPADVTNFFTAVMTVSQSGKCSPCRPSLIGSSFARMIMVLLVYNDIVVADAGVQYKSLVPTLTVWSL